MEHKFKKGDLISHSIVAPYIVYKVLGYTEPPQPSIIMEVMQIEDIHGHVRTAFDENFEYATNLRGIIAHTNKNNK